MKYALLIDSENAQPKMDDIFQELSKYGDTPIRYLIGDFTKSQAGPWLEICQKHAITCIQTMNFTKGKNSLDISLVIEGMKVLYEKTFVDGVIIIASDSDYTPLAREWRNAGKEVIGIGRKNTPESYRASCTTFIYTENIYNQTTEKFEAYLPISKIGEVMESVLNDNNGKALLSVVVSAVKKTYSDFDVRNYGYQKAIDFFKNEFINVEIIQDSRRTFSLGLKAVEPKKQEKSVEKKTIKKETSKKPVKKSSKKKPAKKQTTKSNVIIKESEDDLDFE